MVFIGRRPLHVVHRWILCRLIPHDAVKRKPGTTKILLLFREKTMILSSSSSLSVGSQNGIYFWLVSFLKEVRSFPIFWAGLGFLSFRRHRDRKSLSGGLFQIGITTCFPSPILLMGSLFLCSG
jgi:hypothetical protein